jgi:hypothetical protein
MFAFVDRRTLSAPIRFLGQSASLSLSILFVLTACPSKPQDSEEREAPSGDSSNNATALAPTPAETIPANATATTTPVTVPGTDEKPKSGPVRTLAEKKKAKGGEGSVSPARLLSELTTATRRASGTDPLDAINQVERWEKLLKGGRMFEKYVDGRVTEAEKTVEEFLIKAKAKPSKAKAYKKMAVEAEKQAETLFDVQEKLAASNAKLEKEINRIRSHPDVDKLLKLRALQKRVKDKVKESNEILPRELRGLVPEDK